MAKEIEECPFCKAIGVDGIKCRYCREFLKPLEEIPQSESKEEITISEVIEENTQIATDNSTLLI